LELIERPPQMRTMSILAIALILLGAVLMIFWFGTDLPVAFQTPPPPPGQYPIDGATPEWPASRQSSAFAPASAMGSNTTVSDGTDAAAPKVACALGRGRCLQ
jgi:hypothetical protein